MRYLLWLLIGTFIFAFSFEAYAYRNSPHQYHDRSGEFYEGDIAGPENRFEYNLYDRMENQQSPNQEYDRQQYYYYQFKEGDSHPQFRRSQTQQF